MQQINAARSLAIDPLVRLQKGFRSARDLSEQVLALYAFLEDIRLEQRLEELLAQIEGAGAVRVLLTEDVGRETVWQTDVQKDADSVREDTVILEDSGRNENGLVRQTTEPSYRGAVILCQGADAPSVKLAIVEAVRCVTGLGADQISVQKMN